MQNEPETPETRQAVWNRRHRQGLAHRLDAIQRDVAALRDVLETLVMQQQQQPPPDRKPEARR
jgi:hypothetical protein